MKAFRLRLLHAIERHFAERSVGRHHAPRGDRVFDRERRQNRLDQFGEQAHSFFPLTISFRGTSRTDPFLAAAHLLASSRRLYARLETSPRAAALWACRS